MTISTHSFFHFGNSDDIGAAFWESEWLKIMAISTLKTNIHH